MKLDKKTMQENLKACLPGIETGYSILDGADSFIFHDGKIYSYNSTVAVAVPMNIPEEAEKLEGIVSANELFKLISKLPQDEFELTANDKSFVVKCGKMKAELAQSDFDYLTRINSLDFSGDWLDISDDIIHGMRICKMKKNKTALSGLYFNGKYIISTDGYQINRYEMKEADLPVFWLSDKCCDVLMKLKDVKRIQVTDKWVHVMTADESIFSVKPLNTERYPYEKIDKLLSIKLDDIDAQGVFPSAMFNAIDRAIMFGAESDRGSLVKLDISKDNIVVSAGKSNGSYTETVEWATATGDFDAVTIFVDDSMLTTSQNNSARFFINEVANGLPRLIFKTDKSIHMYSTFKGKE